MTEIKAKNDELASGKPALFRLKSNLTPSIIFITSFSDFP
jgi:hypothetical protein